MSELNPPGENTIKQLLEEVSYKATTSGGKGGQNVNKVATRIELYFNIRDSRSLLEEQKELLLKKLGKHVSEEGILRITSSEHRTQFKNREAAAEKFVKLINKAFSAPKKRKATKPSPESKEARLEEKKRQSEKKRRRTKTGD